MDCPKQEVARVIRISAKNNGLVFIWIIFLSDDDYFSGFGECLVCQHIEIDAHGDICY